MDNLVVFAGQVPPILSLPICARLRKGLCCAYCLIVYIVMSNTVSRLTVGSSREQFLVQQVLPLHVPVQTVHFPTSLFLPVQFYGILYGLLYTFSYCIFSSHDYDHPSYSRRAYEPFYTPHYDSYSYGHWPMVRQHYV